MGSLFDLLTPDPGAGEPIPAEIRRAVSVPAEALASGPDPPSWRLSALVAELYRRGVTYRADPDGQLDVDAPPGALTPDLCAALQARRVDLLALCASGVTIYGRGRELTAENADETRERTAP